MTIRRTPFAVAAGVLAVLGFSVGIVAQFLADPAQRLLATGAMASGAAATFAAAVLFAGRTVGGYTNRRGMVGRGPAVPLAVFGLALVSSAAGGLSLFLGHLPLLAWVMIAVCVITVVVGVVCAVIDDDEWPFVLVVAVCLVALGGAVYGIFVLFRIGQPGWAWLTIGGLLALVIVTVIVAVRRFSLSESEPKIPATVRWVGLAVAIGVALFIQRGYEAIPLLALYAAGQLMVQQAMLYTFVPRIGRSNVEQIAAEARRRAHRSGALDGPAGKYRQRFEELLERRSRAADPAEIRMLEHQIYDLQGLLAERHDRDRLKEAVGAGAPPLRRGRVQRVRSGLFVPAAAVAISSSTAHVHGVVLDDLWPRLELVVPAPLRRRLAWADHGIALSRVVAASAVGAAVVLTISRQYSLLTIVALGLVLAIATGRRQVSDVYTGKAAAIGVHRMDLVRALSLRPPGTEDELVALGAILAGQDVDPWQDGPVALASESGPASGGTEPVLIEQLREVVISELRVSMDRLANQQRALLSDMRRLDLSPGNVDQIASKVVDRAVTPLTNQVAEGLTARLTSGFTQLQAQLSASVIEAVETAMVGPELLNFSGYLLVELADTERSEVRRSGPGLIAAQAGATVTLTVSLIDDPQAADSVPNRRSVSDGPYVALETVTIEGGRTEQIVPFDALVDSATLTPSPHRIAMRVTRPHGEHKATLTLDLPDTSGVHEAWLQLFQAGRLVQAIVLAVDTRG